MKPKIALFVHQPKCSIQSGNGIMQSLSKYYDFKIFTKHKVEDDFFDDIQITAFPGGIGDSDSYEFLFRENGNQIKQFVRRGGKYLGVCMGGYWASKHYFDLLDGIEAHQYIKRPHTDTRRPHAKNQRVLWSGEEHRMFFYDGPAFVGPGLATSEIVSLYPNGDPMALIQGNVGVIGCHLESTPHWYKEYSWMRGLYHDGVHHKLLLEFTDRLLTN